MIWGVRRAGKAVVLSCLFVVGFMGSQAAASTNGMRVNGPANPPVGQASFCQRFADQCQRRGGLEEMQLTKKRMKELSEVNRSVNDRILPATDMEIYGVEEYWTIPVRYGDCEDYVLLKQRDLLEKGWPSSNVLVAVVFDEVGEGHAVLVVRTSEGDLILDNKVGEVKAWTQTPYRYVKRQSEADPRKWTLIGDDRWNNVATATTR